MLYKSSIGSISFPNYIRKVKISKSQRNKYYIWNEITIKTTGKKLLQKYINPIYKKEIIINNGNVRPEHLQDDYVIVGFKGDKIYSVLSNVEIIINKLTYKQLEKETKYILCSIDYNNSAEWRSYLYTKVIANTTQTGKPKYRIINGQNIYNHTLDPFSLGKIFDAIKLSYYQKVNKINKHTLKRFKKVLNVSYPLIIEVEIKDTLKNKFDITKNDVGRRWDVGNRADPYMKTFLDFLTNGYKDKEGNILLEPLIIDDDRLHISSGNNAIFTPIQPDETPELVFHFYKDTRIIWKKILKNIKLKTNE